MALAASAARQQLSVLVSDVPEQSLDALASGPTMADSTAIADCYDIVAKYELLPRFPARVHEIFEHQALEETPKDGDPAFAHSHYATVLSNATAVQAARDRAARAGYTVEVDNSCDDWDYVPAADHLLERLRHLRGSTPRACVISGGEVTVRVTARRASADAISNLRCIARRRSRARTLRCSAPAPMGSTGTVLRRERLPTAAPGHARKPRGLIVRRPWRASMPIRCFKGSATPSSPGLPATTYAICEFVGGVALG